MGGFKFNPFTSNLDEVGGDSGGGVPTTRTLEIDGTTDQVIVTPDTAQDLSANRSWVISLPQDIAEDSSPTFAGLTLSDLPEGSVLFAAGGGLVTEDASLNFNTVTKALTAEWITVKKASYPEWDFYDGDFSGDGAGGTNDGAEIAIDTADGWGMGAGALTLVSYYKNIGFSNLNGDKGVLFDFQSGATRAILDFGDLTTTDKTFTFPNASGTIALTSDISYPVTSVFSRTGAVVAATNDYTWAQINKATSDIADIATRSHTSLTDIGTNNHAAIDSHIADATIHFTVGSINHGSIAGLADDDHTQYVLVTGARAMDMLTVNGTTQGIIAEITGFNAVNAGRFIIDSTDGSTVGAIYASNDTNFAHSGFIGKFEAKNAGDSAVILSLVNAGTGNYITADSVFTVAKSGLTTITTPDIQVTTTQGFVLRNDTDSTSGVTAQWPAAIDLLGHAWKSGLGSGDRDVRVRMESQPQTSAGTPNAYFTFKTSTDTGTPSWRNFVVLNTAKTLVDQTVSGAAANTYMELDTVDAVSSAGFLTTPGFTWLKISSAGTEKFRIDWHAGNSTRLYGVGRMDIESATQIYFTAPSGFFMQSNTSVNRTGDASSVATQKNSYIFNTQVSVWNGASAEHRFAQFRATSSTTVGEDYSLVTYLGGNDANAVGTEVMRVFWDDSASRAYVGIGVNAPTSHLDVLEDIRGRQLHADGDNAGIAGTVGVTNVVDAVDANPISVFDHSSAGLGHTGYLKIYDEGVAKYIPVMEFLG